MSRLKNKETSAYGTEVEFFDTLVNGQRKQVISWLMFKYENLPLADAEDIVTDATVALWEKLKDLNGWAKHSHDGLYRTIARNTYTHWLQKKHGMFREDWDDVDFRPVGESYPQDDGVEYDYEYISSETARMLLKEQMYWMIDQLKPKERDLMNLYLDKVDMKEIAARVGFSSQQVAKNKKRSVVVRLHEEAINGQALDACPFLFVKFFVYQECRALQLAGFYKAKRLKECREFYYGALLFSCFWYL